MAEKPGENLMEFKKLVFTEEDKIQMKKLREKLSSIEMDDEELSKVYASAGCGGICKNSCSYYCEPGCERTCADSCSTRCSDFMAGAADCFLCSIMRIIWVP
jgi:hypothetical protein